MTPNEELDVQSTQEATDRLRRLVHPPTAEIARLHIDAMIAEARRARFRRTRRMGVRLLTAAALTLGAGALALPIVSQGDERRTEGNVKRPEGVSEGKAAGGVPVGADETTSIGEVGAQDGSENSHGRAVSELAKAVEPGPGHGKVVSEVASAKSEDNRQDTQHRSQTHGKSAEAHGKAKGKSKGARGGEAPRP